MHQVLNVDQLSVDDIKNHRLSDVFAEFSKLRTQLTERQWLAVTLAYKVGLAQEEVAEQMQIGRTAVTGLLRRARRKKEAHDRRLRKERYDLMRHSFES